MKEPPPMAHKYSVGQLVNFEGMVTRGAASGDYTIVSLVPIERDNRLTYRIKSPLEPFERIVEEHELSIVPD